MPKHPGSVNNAKEGAIGKASANAMEALRIEGGEQGAFDVVATRYASASNIDTEPPKSKTKEMLYILLPNYFANDSASVPVVAIVDYVETRQKKICLEGLAKICTYVPSTIIKAREINNCAIPYERQYRSCT